MAESRTRLELAINLLATSGFIEARESDRSDIQKLAGGLARCVDALDPQFDVVSIENLTLEENLSRIEEALSSMEDCPYKLEARKIRNLDGESLFLVVQWLIDRVRSSQSDRKDESQRNIVVLNRLQRLRESVSNEGVETEVKMLVSLLRSLEDLKRQESNFQTCSEARHSQLDDEIADLKEKIASGCDSESLSDELNISISESTKELDSARKELAATLRAVLALKRRLDDVPSDTELRQYEQRFSELYGHIQGKHQQTQKYYDTYNALLEIRDLMLKETSLLNSISSQFQDAITSTTGRAKLIDSMEGIVKSSQQKLVKVQLGLEEQQRICDTLKEKYTTELAGQRHRSSLLKSFQGMSEDEMLRSSSAVEKQL